MMVSSDIMKHAPNETEQGNFRDNINNEYNMAIFMINSMEKDIFESRKLINNNNNKFEELKHLNILLSEQNLILQVIIISIIKMIVIALLII